MSEPPPRYIRVQNEMVDLELILYAGIAEDEPGMVIVKQRAVPEVRQFAFRTPEAASKALDALIHSMNKFDAHRLRSRAPSSWSHAQRVEEEESVELD